MASTKGSGVLTFGSLTGKFFAKAGFSIDGKKVVAVDVTPDDTTVGAQYSAGDIAEYGQVKGDLIVEMTSATELESLIGTEATLTWTPNKTASGSSSAGTFSGTAIFLEAPIKSEANGAITASAVFQWTQKYTIANEA
jgi:hypothetical protein